VGEGPGEADQLLLAGGEACAALFDGVFGTVGERVDEVGEVDLIDGVAETVVIDTFGTQADVVFESSGKEEGVLEDDGEAAAEFVEGYVADVDAADFDGTLLYVVEAAAPTLRLCRRTRLGRIRWRR